MLIQIQAMHKLALIRHPKIALTTLIDPGLIRGVINSRTKKTVHGSAQLEDCLSCL